MLEKADIQQTGIRMILDRKNAIFLITSCVLQMFIFGLSTGEDITLKFIFMGFSVIFMMLLLCNVWFMSNKADRTRLLTRILIFTIIFNLLIILVGRFLGGIMVFAVGIVFMCTLIKINNLKAD